MRRESVIELTGILEERNILQAYSRVLKNSAKKKLGPLKRERLKLSLENTTKELLHGDLRQRILAGTHRPKPLLRRTLAKRDGGTREVLVSSPRDKMIQTAILLPLQKRIDPILSEAVYGFRPGRNAQQAALRAQELLRGYPHVACLDIYNCFPSINRDRLIHDLSDHTDPRTRRLIHLYLNQCRHGIPAGTVLSPLLANLYLDPVDRSLERVGSKFIRYADNILVFSRSDNDLDFFVGEWERFLLKRNLSVGSHAEGYLCIHDFLGFEIQLERICPAKSRMETALKEGKTKDLGWLNYYKFHGGDTRVAVSGNEDACLFGMTA